MCQRRWGGGAVCAGLNRGGIETGDGSKRLSATMRKIAKEKASVCAYSNCGCV